MTCSCSTTTNPPRFSSGIFKFGQLFQRGDLPLYIKDSSGNPFSPAIVTYTLFMYAPGNPSPIQIGCAERVPVMSDVGEYYISACAGQCGQAGDWFVRWHFKETSSSPVHEALFAFKVFNTATVASSCCPLPAKYGWT